MADICGDNRFELIEKCKQKLLDATNISDSPEEMAVIDNILFRFWQMGWLKGELFGNSEQLDDTISRQVAIKAICEDGTRLERKGQYSMTMAERKQRDADILEGLPSAQPETAKCIVGKSRDGMTLWYQCDMCNEPVDAQDNFCRGCGRRLTDG